MNQLLARNKLSVTSNSPCALVKALRQINLIGASEEIKEITMNCGADMFTLTGVLLNGTRKQALPEVNSLFDDVQESEDREEVCVQQLQSEVHPKLRPLINRMRLAVIKGAKCNKRRQRNSNDGEAELEDLMSKLQDDIIEEQAADDDIPTLRSKAVELHRLISESAARKREEEEVEKNPVVSILVCVLPILAEVEKVIANQRNAEGLLETFLAHVDLVLIIGMMRNVNGNPEPASSSLGRFWCPKNDRIQTDAICRVITLSVNVIPSVVESVIRKALSSRRS